MRISRALADLGAASALSALLFATGVQVPLVGQAAVFLSAVPLIWASARLGPAPGALGALLGTALLLPVLPPPVTLIFLIEHALPAPFLGWWLMRGSAVSRGAALAALVVTALVVGATYLIAGGAGRDPVLLLEEQLRAAFVEISGGAEGDAAPSAPPNLDEIFALVRRVLPALTLVGIYLECALTALLAARLLVRGGAAVRPPDLAAFSLPDWLVWALIASLALTWAPLPWVRTAALNALLPLLFAFLLQGFSILLHLAARARVSRLGRVLAAAAFAVSPWLLGIPLLVGALDFRVAFRTRWPIAPPSLPAP